ncbi:MAG: carboxypeptidase-like regulatory domain-containing protein [bacterium]
MSIACLILSTLAAVPTGTISGVVLDVATRSPLAGASVIVTDTDLGAACDPDGRFIITGVPTGVWSVEASMIGYRSQARNPVVVRSGRPYTAWPSGRWPGSSSSSDRAAS